MTWRHKAACLDSDADFFVNSSSVGRGRHTNDSMAPALALCVSCAVTGDCLAFALATPEARDFGVWGGTTKGQRTKLRRSGRTPAAPIQDLSISSRSG